MDDLFLEASRTTHLLFTDSLLGWLTLIAIFFFIILWTKKYPKVKIILLIAFLIRSILIIFEQYELILLPESSMRDSDASDYERSARIISYCMQKNAEICNTSKYGSLNIFSFFKTNSLLISRIIGIFYTIFGESAMMAKGISVGLGTASVFLVYNLSMLLWDERSAQKAAWVAALFPSLILYSALILREVYVVFFLLIALVGIAKFMKKKTFISFLQISFGFLVVIQFHGPVFIGAFVFIFLLNLDLIKNQSKNLYNFRVNKNFFPLTLLLMMPVILYIFGYYKIPYLDAFSRVADLSFLIERANIGIKDSSSYPSWMIINGYYDFLPKMIIKGLYFLYSPFIWDIRYFSHLIVLLDAMAYIVLSGYVFLNWQVIWKNPVTRIFFIMFIVFVFVYGFGLGNFGTSFRHRSKFVVILIILAAPKIHKFIFSLKKKYTVK
ncbi:hypothetical protein N8724_06340 [Candidatus Pelagibacter sp.]|nr:hypothetical protein [Candidatus Pelagibacter sp.]